MTLSSNFWINNFLLAVVLPGALFLCMSYAARKFSTKGFYNESRVKSAIDNVILFYLNGFIYGFIFTGIALAAKTAMADTMPQVGSALWEHLALPLQILVALIVLDFVNYWNHRALHTAPLWGIHAVHHADKHMTWTTSYRVHVFEGLVMALGVVLLSGWLNLPVEAVGIAGVIQGLHNKYVHCQVGWAHGPLRKWIISPNNHRWHHAAVPEAYNKNFGDIFAVWDRMFGTYYDPYICDVEIGLEEGPHTLVEVMIHPFKYWHNEYIRPLRSKRAEGQV